MTRIYVKRVSEERKEDLAMPKAEQSGGWLGQVIERSKKAAESGPKPMLDGHMRHLTGNTTRDSRGSSSGNESCYR
ncbi:MAG TPA: hypothetical protein VE891_09690 [Allosphingosinicella sp.]|nr:hypothetical protein [Allosphingosinicella sp.]